MAKNIQKMLIRQLSNPKNWTKKKIAMIAVAVLTACVANKFGHTNSQSSTVLGKKGETYTAQVVKVADGDTITVSDTYGAKHRIRFAYIDAPEKSQAYGMASKSALEKLVANQQVQVYVTDVDRYSREVAVISMNGLEVNYEQVKNGNAWHYQTYAKKTQSSGDYSQYAAALAAAQKNRIGLWGGKNPQAPWEYRVEQRKK